VSPDGERVPIFLCCAEENEVALVGAVAKLRSQGLQPDVVPGVELDAGILATAVDQNLGAGLYVLCQSEDLDRFQVRRLEGLFSARRGPAHRLFIVELDAENPLAIVSEITAAVAALEAGEAEPPPDEDAPDARHLRDVVGPRYADDRPRRAPVKKQARQPSYEPPKTSPGRTPAHRRPISHGADRDRPAPRERADTARTPDLHELAAQVAPPPSEPAAARVVDPPALEDRQGPEAAATAAPAVSQPRAASRSSPLVWMGLGGLVVLVVAGIALVQDRGSIGETEEPSAPPPSPVVAEAPADVTHTDGKTEPLQETETEPVPQDLPPPPPPLEEPPPPPDPSHPGPDEDTLIVAAIAAGKIRAIDLLIFVPPRKGRVLPWLEAANHCKAKRVGGVRRFRLPSVREIRKIRNARMLPEGDYWTGTLSKDDDESVYVLDTSLRSVTPWHKSEEATPICVRTKK
jgi:hypothetical protein